MVVKFNHKKTVNYSWRFYLILKKVYASKSKQMMEINLMRY
jgi:hypothetical protein